MRKEVLKKTFSIIIVFLILTGGGCTKNDDSDIGLESAKKDFYPLTFSFTEQRKEDTLVAFTQITGEGDLLFVNEVVNYEKTTYSGFPYTANHILTLAVKNPNPYEFVFAEQLFLYDSSRTEWLPISDSISKVYTKNKKVINKIISTSNLWEEGNDWRELHKYTEPTTKEVLQEIQKYIQD